MIEKCEIRPIPVSSQANGGRAIVPTSTLFCETLLSNTWIILTENFYILPKHALTEEKWKNERILQIDFNQQRPIFMIEYDTESIYAGGNQEPSNINRAQIEDDLNTRKRTAVFDFFGRHMQVKQLTNLRNGHKPSNASFTMELITQKERNSHINDKRRMEVFNQVEAMQFQDQYNLALYYRPELFGRRRSVILQGLIGLKGIATEQDFAGGILMREPYTSDFLSQYKDNPTVVIKTYIHKAIPLGILVKRPNDGIYMNGNTFVGKDETEAVVYFSNNTQDYANHVVSQVNKYTVLPEDDMDPFAAVGAADKILAEFGKKEIENKAYDKREEWDVLKAKAERLGIKRLDMYTHENLVKKIAAMESEMDEMITKTGLPTKDIENFLETREAGVVHHVDQEMEDLREVAAKLQIRSIDKKNKQQLIQSIEIAKRNLQAIAKEKEKKSANFGA